MGSLESDRLEQDKQGGISCFPIQRNTVDQFTKGFDQELVRRTKFWDIQNTIQENDKNFDKYLSIRFYNDNSLSAFIPGMVLGYGLFLEQMRANNGLFPLITEKTIAKREQQIGMDLLRILRNGQDVRDVYTEYKFQLLGNEQYPSEENKHLVTAVEIMSEYAFGDHFTKGIVEIYTLVAMSLQDNLEYEYY